MKRFRFSALLQVRRDSEQYPVKILGTVLCSHPGIEEICRAMAEMYTVSRQKVKKLSKYNLTVSPKGITLEKVSQATQNSSVKKKFAIERIVYCGVDQRHQKILAFFYRSPESVYGGLDCHVIECRSRHDAKHIALTISDIFQRMAAEKQEPSQEDPLSQPNVIHERTLSMIRLHMSVESLSEQEESASPRIQRSKPLERILNYSELQLHSNRCENNSSGYGDSSDDLSNETNSKIKQRQRLSSEQVEDSHHYGECSQMRQVNRDYVNTGITSKFKYICRKHEKFVYPNGTGLSQIKEWDSSQKDRNANPVSGKILAHEYMNINMKEPGARV